MLYHSVLHFVFLSLFLDPAVLPADPRLDGQFAISRDHVVSLTNVTSYHQVPGGPSSRRPHDLIAQLVYETPLMIRVAFSPILARSALTSA